MQRRQPDHDGTAGEWRFGGHGGRQGRRRGEGGLEEKQGDNTALTFGGTASPTAKRAIKRVLTQNATGTYGFGSNGFGGFQIPSLLEIGHITDTTQHTFMVPLKAVTEDESWVGRTGRDPDPRSWSR